MQTALKNKAYSVEEYLLLEESSEVRHEFSNGYLYEMSGESDNHNLICQNLLLFFRSLLKPKGFYTFIKNMKVKIHNENIYYILTLS
jgi:Uma2 family endonuclease